MNLSIYSLAFKQNKSNFDFFSLHNFKSNVNKYVRNNFHGQLIANLPFSLRIHFPQIKLLGKLRMVAHISTNILSVIIIKTKLTTKQQWHKKKKEEKLRPENVCIFIASISHSIIEVELKCQQVYEFFFYFLFLYFE